MMLRVLMFLVSVVVAIFACSIFINNANSMMLKAEDSFREASNKDINLLNSIDSLSPYLRDDKAVIRVDKRFIGDKKTKIVRIENKQCTEECLTVFFENEISKSNLLGYAYLPAKATTGDYAISPCNECRNEWPLIFEFDSGAQRFVYILGQNTVVGGR